MQIVLVRHGETEWSRSGQHTSRTDLPLIEEGRERAVLLGPLLAEWEFSLVLTSPLRRARETCELAGYGDRAVVCEDLCEWDYGEYEGLTTPQIREQDPSWNLWTDGCPDGEQPAQVGARADAVLERMRGVGHNGYAVAFAHGHILRVVTARWLQMQAAAGSRFALGTGSLSVLGFERETQVLQLWSRVP
ncbi:MAG TPA: histidine phosphatase family protein [Solirubrobacteraceae bacterium]|nr:histidine phosphatase family protein [Solirubrobacteraceae bacterium]